jgi:hypothetical protein
MAINPVLTQQKRGEYINTKEWRHVILNGTKIIFPASITGFSSNHRVFEYQLESGTGNAVEFSGRQPYDFTIEIKIIGQGEDHYDAQIQYLFSLIDTSMSEAIEISHPKLKKHKINKFYVTGWSYKEIDYYMVLNLKCKEYQDYVVQYLDGFQTPEEITASNITQDDVDEVDSTFEDIIRG